MSADSEHGPWFGRLYAAGTVLFREGEPGDEMFVIRSGSVRLTRRRKGEDKLVALLPAGEFFGEMAIVNRRPRSATATVVEDAKMICIDSRTFETMIRENTEIAMRLIKKLAGRLDKANRQIDVLFFRDTNQRVVQALRRLAVSHGVPDEAGVRIDISLDRLADRVGLAAEEVAKALERLDQVGLVTCQSAGAGYLVAEDGQLQEFLEFQEMKQKFG